MSEQHREHLQDHLRRPGPLRRRDRAGPRSGAARPGQGYVAVTVGFTELGAYLGRDLSGVTGLVLFIATIPLVLALHIAAARGREQPAIGLLFGLGLAATSAIADYASADPPALRQGAGAAAAFVAAHGAYGYATRRCLSSWARTLFRTLFRALFGLIVFGIVVIFASIPDENIIYAVAGLVIFGVFHDLRLQPPAPQHPRRNGAHRGPDLPRHRQRLSAGPGSVRRPAGTEPCQPTTPKESPR